MILRKVARKKRIKKMMFIIPTISMTIANRFYKALYIFYAFMSICSACVGIVFFLIDDKYISEEIKPYKSIAIITYFCIWVVCVDMANFYYKK